MWLPFCIRDRASWCRTVNRNNTRAHAKAIVEGYLAGLELPHHPVGDYEWALAVTGNSGMLLSVNLTVGDYTLGLFCFFVRAPDENVGEVYRLLLRKQLDMYAVKFCLEDDGDLYLKAEIPLAGLSEQELDRVLGCFQYYADQTYPTILRLGWASQVR